MEQRDYLALQNKRINQIWKEFVRTAKSFDIPKQLVWEAYTRVKANKGAAGVDKQSIEAFEKGLKNNLYKLWNRMSSGSYFPPAVRMVEIPKSDGGKRQLGIPTVADRVAQMVAKLKLEPELEAHFHEDSYGYRPGKSAHQAVNKARQRCWEKAWVIDLDIKGFFDNLDHDLLMRAVERHTSCKWLLLYIQRWLTAPIQLTEGQIQQRDKGTPQGGVISPLLANLFLHYAFDKWIEREYPNIQFERYADDVIVHCRTEDEATSLKDSIAKRLNDCKLELHPNKTKVVYCKDVKRKRTYNIMQFDFLGFTFRPRLSRNKEGKFFVGFNPAISQKAAKAIHRSMRKWKLHLKCNRTLKEIAHWINPTLRGWINYYGKFHKSALYPIFNLLNRHLSKWATFKYKKLKDKQRRALHWLGRIAKANSSMLAHWAVGIRPAIGARRAV